MRDLTIPYDVTSYHASLGGGKDSVIFAFKKNNPSEMNDRLCVDALPGFDELTRQQQALAISNAFTNIADYIVNDQRQYLGSPTTAMIFINYIKKINGQTTVNLITASVAGCNIYYVIKDKMDKIKKYERLNNVVFKDDFSSTQDSSDRKYSHIDVSHLINSFKTIQVEHFEIPLADDEELFLIAAKGIMPISLAQTGIRQGDDAKNISFAYSLRRWCDVVTHFINYQSTNNHALAISRTIDSSTQSSEPVLMGIFSGYNGSYLSELLVQTLPDEIFSQSLNFLEKHSQLVEVRSKHHECLKNACSGESDKPIPDKGLCDIYPLMTSRATKISGLKEISDYFSNKYVFDDAQSLVFLLDKFVGLIATIEMTLIHQDVLDIHQNNILDKYVLFIDKSDSWRQLVKELRDLAFHWLENIAEKCETNEEAVKFLNEYRNHKVFSTHRANHWFQKIGRTQTVVEIDQLIEDYQTSRRLEPI